MTTSLKKRLPNLLILSKKHKNLTAIYLIKTDKRRIYRKISAPLSVILAKLKIMKIKFILLIAIIAAFGSIGFAQTKKPKTAVAPSFKGSPQTQKKAFKAFIIKNVGKRVSLKLSFGEDIPYGYRSEFADPLFEVDNYLYFLVCNDKAANAEWTNRCGKLNWNAADKIITGFFKITEPDPKRMRTNRTFHITPTK